MKQALSYVLGIQAFISEGREASMLPLMISYCYYDVVL